MFSGLSFFAQPENTILLSATCSFAYIQCHVKNNFDIDPALLKDSH